MNKEETLLQLFMRESPESELFSLDSFDLTVSENATVLKSEAFIEWAKTKRDLEHNDVATTHWIKTCTEGYITEVIFHKEGTLNEYRLFDRFPTQGFWYLTDGILKVEISKNENTYCFSVVGNAELNIHSAVEYKNNQLHAFLKLAQIKE